MQFLQPPIAHNLLEGVRGQSALQKNGISRLKCVVAGAVEAAVVQEFALRVQVQGASGHRGAGCNPAVLRIPAYFNQGNAAFCRMVFDGGALIYGHERLGDPEKSFGVGRPFLCAERLNIHDQNAKLVRSFQHGLHFQLLRLAGRGGPTGHAVADVVRHVLGYFTPVPVLVDPLRGHNQHGVDLAFVVEHCAVVYQHKALSRPHFSEQSHVFLLPKPL